MGKSVGTLVRTNWETWRSRPYGRQIFSRLMGFVVPYTGTIRPLVLELGPGHARVQMQDRRIVRNHLRSVHAIALMNLGEFTTGLAFSYALPEGARFILKGLSIEFLKKARGTVTAECNCVVPETVERSEHVIESAIHDASGDVVARVRAQWLLGPAEARTEGASSPEGVPS
jgi:acyl-coenzyme A thioesterase PaaI-like protein